jgi:NADPH:quinone reductase-like Zn-dependent oxidoreductase
LLERHNFQNIPPDILNPSFESAIEGSAMRAAVLHKVGSAPRFEQFEDPVASDGEVLVKVLAASLKAVDKTMAAGSHYASFRELPAICGVDGVGRLETGERVLFGGCRRPFGTMAERTVAPRAFCFPLPDGVDDATAAALPNPAASSWLPLKWRAQLKPGETVLVLGATGTAGKLAVQIAKILGAGRVIAAGRNPQQLEAAKSLGADTTIQIDAPGENLVKAFAAVAKDGIDVVLDYLWGAPTEALVAALTGHDLAAEPHTTRLIEIGESAGPAISLSGAALRSSGLEIYGSGGGSVPKHAIAEALPQIFEHAVRGSLKMETKKVPLAEVETQWHRKEDRRVVFIP